MRKSCFVKTFLLIVLFSLFFVSPTYVFGEELRWIMPNILDELGTKNYDQIFIDENQWKNILPKVNVFSFFPQTIDREGNIILPQAIPLLQKYNVALEVGAGYPQSGGCGIDTGKIAATYHLTFLKKIYDYGGRIDYLSVDGAMLGTMQSKQYGGCEFTTNQAVKALVDYIKTIHATYPDIKIGIIVNFPNWPYKETPNYWGGTLHGNLPDYSVVLEKAIAGINAAGEKIYYVNTDNPYDYAIATHPSSNVDVKKIDWLGRIIDLEKQVKSHGLKFGLMYNSETGASVSDQQYYEDTINYINLYKSRGGAPDYSIIESWYTRPSNLFPDNQPYTFTYLVANVFSNASIPTPTPTQPSCSLKSQGDANCDGVVNMIDYFYLVRALNGGKIPSSVNPDFNGDGEIGLSDRSIIVKTLRAK